MTRGSERQTQNLHVDVDPIAKNANSFSTSVNCGEIAVGPNRANDGKIPNEHDAVDPMLDATLDQPATRRDLLALEAVTRGDLAAHQEAARRDLLALEEAVRRDLGATNLSVRALEEATHRDLLELEARLHRHFDVAIESFKTEFGNLYDWTQATTSALRQRLDHFEQNHGTRLTSAELRLTRLERPRK